MLFPFSHFSSEIRLLIQDRSQPQRHYGSVLDFSPTEGFTLPAQLPWEPQPWPYTRVPASLGPPASVMLKECLELLQLPGLGSLSSSSPAGVLGHALWLALLHLHPPLWGRPWMHIAGWSPAWAGPSLSYVSRPCATTHTAEGMASLTSLCLGRLKPKCCSMVCPCHEPCAWFLSLYGFIICSPNYWDCTSAKWIKVSSDQRTYWWDIWTPTFALKIILCFIRNSLNKMD